MTFLSLMNGGSGFIIQITFKKWTFWTLYPYFYKVAFLRISQLTAVCTASSQTERETREKNFLTDRWNISVCLVSKKGCGGTYTCVCQPQRFPVCDKLAWLWGFGEYVHPVCLLFSGTCSTDLICQSMHHLSSCKPSLLGGLLTHQHTQKMTRTMIAMAEAEGMQTMITVAETDKTQLSKLQMLDPSLGVVRGFWVKFS